MSKKSTVNEPLSRTERAAAIRSQHQAGERRQRNLIVAVVAVVMLAIIIAVGYTLMSQSDPTGDGAKKPTNATEKYGAVVGKANAPVEVVVYEDFLCPACGQFEQTAATYLGDQVKAGGVKVEYRMISILDGASADRYSTRSANAWAVVLHEHGPQVAEEFHHLLYANQPAEGGAGLTGAELIDLAVEAGADEATVAGGIKGEQFKQWIANATDQASKDGVNGTPTVLVDGEMLKNPFAELDSAIQTALTETQ